MLKSVSVARAAEQSSAKLTCSRGRQRAGAGTCSGQSSDQCRRPGEFGARKDEQTRSSLQTGSINSASGIDDDPQANKTARHRLETPSDSSAEGECGIHLSERNGRPQALAALNLGERHLLRVCNMGTKQRKTRPRSCEHCWPRHGWYKQVMQPDYADHER
jgi:hypothetical protein